MTEFSTIMEAGPADSYDVGIIGGGPAGLSAAIWAARYGHRVVLVDSGDPRNWETRGVNGYLGLPGVRPPELRKAGRKEAEKHDVRLVDATVLRAERCGEELFRLHVEGGDTLECRRVLLAIGMKDYWPDLPGLEKVYGANAHVCPDCDGYECRDKRTVVIGHGKRAVAMALALTTWTGDIVILTNGRAAGMDDEELQAKLAVNGIRVCTTSIERVNRSGSSINCIDFVDGTSLDVDKLFFTIAQFPADDTGAQLGCDRDRGGHIVVDKQYRTSVEHVYAAGDITPGPQLAIRAASAGATAALYMHKSLVPESRKLAARPRRGSQPAAGDGQAPEDAREQQGAGEPEHAAGD